MKNLLITGGTVFVSRYAAEYFTGQGYNVFTLNRNSRPQPAGVTLIEADRHELGEKLRGYRFDAVLDITAYSAEDVNLLLDALDSFDDYLLLSSSAVYPETGVQPFTEEAHLGRNKFWGDYGIGKIGAEEALLRRVPNAYILRPPYIYGPMNNVYREAFVFDCALAKRRFYLPGDGDMRLQFIHIRDLCRFMELLLAERPARHIFNVGNSETISVREWARLCYEAAGAKAEFQSVSNDIEVRRYFCFADYEYRLDVGRQYELTSSSVPMLEGLREAFEWYRANPDSVSKRRYFEFIDGNFN